MDDVYRRRYNPRTNYARSKRTIKPIKDNHRSNILKQMLSCFIIFAIIFAIKNINIPVTNNIAGWIKDTITNTTNINKLYERFNQKVGLFKKPNIPVFKAGGEEALQSQENDEKINPIETFEDTDLQVRDNKPNEIENETIEIYQTVVPPLNGLITSNFGMRIHPLNKKELFHYGVDINGETGEDIGAAIDGEVFEVDRDDVYGAYVKIKHNDDVYSFYAHCSEIVVKKGDKIKMQETIARVGESGLTSGPHLHFELWKGDKVLNPMHYISLPTE